MKKIILLVVITIFISGCCYSAKNTQAQNAASIVSFEDSNAYFIKECAEQIDIVDLISNKINPDDKVTILPLNAPTEKEQYISNIIEDVLIQKLIQQEYTILNCHFEVPPSLTEEDSIFYDQVYQSKNKNFRKKFQSIDKLITYKILETSVIYGNRQKFSRRITRTTTIILSIKIEDTKTGQILSLKTIKSNTANEIPLQELGTKSNFYYNHYQF